MPRAGRPCSAAWRCTRRRRSARRRAARGASESCCPAAARAASMRIARSGSESSGASTRSCSCGGSISTSCTEASRSSGCASRAARCAVEASRGAGLRQALDGRGAHDRCVREIVGDRRQRRRRTRLSGLGRVKGRRKSLESRGVASEPAAHRGGGPARVTIRVALVAGVRHAERDRLIGARHTHAVIAPAVDDHVGRPRHVAVGALRAGGAGRVTVMRRRVVLARRMTLAADRIAVDAQLLRVRVVAVAAGHALAMHAALQPRAPDEDFVALLAVDVIQPAHQQRRQVVVEERLPGAIALGDLRAPRVALRADLDLAFAGALAAALRVAGRRVDAPGDATPLIEQHRQALRRIGWLLLRPRRCARTPVRDRTRIRPKSRSSACRKCLPAS